MITPTAAAFLFFIFAPSDPSNPRQLDAKAKEANKEPAPAFRLLLLDPPPASIKYELAVEKRIATANEYKAHGVHVEVASAEEFQNWISKDGSRFAKAQPEYQRIGYARHRNVDGIGGFEGGMFRFDYESAAEEPMIGTWFINLKSLQMNLLGYSRDDQNPQPTEIAETFGIASHPLRRWQIETTVTPNTSLNRGIRSRRIGSYLELKPQVLIGISFKEGRIVHIVPDSPADLAGLKIGDRFVSVNDELVELEELSDYLLEWGPAPVTLLFERAGQRQEIKITPVIASEFEKKYRSTHGSKLLRTFRGTDHRGKQFDIDKLKGKLVVLEFWGTWCGPCIATMPEIVLAAKGFNDVELVTVCYQCDEDDWRAYLTDNQLDGIHLRSDEFCEPLLIHGFPTTLLLDATGKIAAECSSHTLPNDIALLRLQAGLEN